MPKSCPICHKSASISHIPFCSERCRLLDLNRWFTGAYAMPALDQDGAENNSMTDAVRDPASTTDTHES